MSHKRLNIAITKSKLKSFSIYIRDDGEVQFNCNLALCTESGHEVTEVSHSTNSWNGKELKVTSKAYQLAGQLAGLLHESTEDHVKNLQNLIESPSL